MNAESIRVTPFCSFGTATSFLHGEHRLLPEWEHEPRFLENMLERARTKQSSAPFSCQGFSGLRFLCVMGIRFLPAAL